MPTCVPIAVVMAAVPTAVAIDRCDLSFAPGPIDYDGSGVAPGSVICLTAGNYSDIRFYDLAGTALNPIIIRNRGGLAHMNNSANEIELDDCNHVILIGNGVAGTPYGIKADGKVLVHGLSSNIRLSHIETDGSGGTHPGIHVVQSDSSSYIMDDYEIDHCYLHDHTNEGMYLGKTDWADPGDWFITNFNVHHNILTTVGEGIQLSSCISGGEIHHNVISEVRSDSGTLPVYAGIMINRGTGRDDGVQIYNNMVWDCDINAVRILGTDTGSPEVWNNLLYDCGVGAAPESGIKSYNDDGTYFNLTVVTTSDHGLELEAVSTDSVYNCVLLASTNASISGGAATSNNDTKEEGHTPANYNFVNAAGDDYHLDVGSPGIDAGTNVGAPADDLDGKTRPVDGTTDIGCYEFGCPA